MARILSRVIIYFSHIVSADSRTKIHQTRLSVACLWQLLPIALFHRRSLWLWSKMDLHKCLCRLPLRVTLTTIRIKQHDYSSAGRKKAFDLSSDQQLRTHCTLIDCLSLIVSSRWLEALCLPVLAKGPARAFLTDPSPIFRLKGGREGTKAKYFKQPF